MNKNLRLCLLLLLLPVFLTAQIKDTLIIPINRVFFHDKIEKEQKLIDKLDGKTDGFFNVGIYEDVNLMLTDELFRKLKETTRWIEQSDLLLTNNDKVKYLTYVEQMLQMFRKAYNSRNLHGVDFVTLHQLFAACMELNAAKENYSALLHPASYPIVKIVTDILSDNPHVDSVKPIVYLKYCSTYPDKILPTIKQWADHPFADSLLVIAGKNNLAQLYSYAQSETTVEGKLIHQSQHPLIRAIAALTKTPQALFYFPFLDDLMTGKKKQSDIASLIGDGEKGYDSVGYYKLLVETEIAYYKRMAPPKRDTPVAMFGVNGLRDMLQKKAIQHFVTPINELHNLSNIQARMKAIEPLNAQELYYVLVMGENDIYTSSYKHAFSRLLQQMGAQPRGDQLLMQVHFDYFRKFIKMAAHYNKLDTFLKTMPVETAEVLMKAFVANLDKTGNLEEAVDVADAYSSIQDTALLRKILSYVHENYNQANADGNERSSIIYGLLKDIFESADASKQIDLTQSLGIPSIYEVPFTQLSNENGVVIQQVFFYGDEDGKAFFPSFVNSFSSKEWKMISKKEWIEFIALNGKVEVYVNKPLDNDNNLDDTAQIHLIQYLDQLGKYPSIVVHRGHSYWLPRTISRMSSDAKIVLLGSCGGYKNLNQILDVCPEAHIISTKEIGKGDLNQPIHNYLNNRMISGKDVVWKDMWKYLDNQFTGTPSAIRESWEDYIPPYRNLGAIFIKAYHRKMQSD
jgi:hypothetical protein